MSLPQTIEVPLNRVVVGDCLRWLQDLPDESVDLICTDPPYGYSFMGKAWDKALPSIDIWKECLRVLKPGAFAFVMSAPRSDVQSRMAIRLEDAGFEIAFTPIYWTYASGFPKAMNIGKMVDKRLGVNREVLGTYDPRSSVDGSNRTEREIGGGQVVRSSNLVNITQATSSDAKALDGSYGGFQPKPAVEVIIVAMKPLSEKTFVDQALKNGKGITWLDECRIPAEQPLTYKGMSVHKPDGAGTFRDDAWLPKELEEKTVDGRFPANLLVENSILDYDESTQITSQCRTDGDNTQIVELDLSSDEHGTEERVKPTAISSHTADPVAKKPAAESLSPSRSTRKLQSTEPLFRLDESPSTTSSDESPSEARTETAPTEDGCKPSSNGMDSNARPVEVPRTYTTTTLNLGHSIQNSDSTRQTEESSVPPAIARQQHTGSSQYSRFFSLDAWWEKTLENLPPEARKTFPFLIVPKAAKSEKNEGLDSFETATVGDGRQKVIDNAFQRGSTLRQNTHPTVKPVKLMSYLITLASRPNDVIVDPFAGSGTTCVAAKLLNRQFIGMELDPEYAKIANARIKAIQQTLL